MNRLVYVGGFGNGKESAERVAHALDPHYGDIATFTFSQAMENRHDIFRATKGANVLTHSAGMMAIIGTDAARIDAFNAPLPTTKRRLLAKTGLKTALMHTPGIDIQNRADLAAVMAYDASALAEFVAHPVANLKQLGNISRFNAVDTAGTAVMVGIPTSLHFTSNDEYYQPSADQLSQAEWEDVSVNWLPGVHDELVLRPQTALTHYIQDISR